MCRSLSLWCNHIYQILLLFPSYWSHVQKVVACVCLQIFFFCSFRISGLMLRSLIHFELIFVHCERWGFSSVFYPCISGFPQHHLLKQLSFTELILLVPLSRIVHCNCMGLLYSTDVRVCVCVGAQCTHISCFLLLRLHGIIWNQLLW
jgi:hypothetical protein